MKKQLLKLTLLVAVLFSASTFVAQEFEEYTTPGVYTINIPGEDLLMTIDPATSGVLWQPKVEGATAATQEWTIQDHVTPASDGLMQITAEIPGAGMFTFTTASEDEESTTFNISVRPGAPKEVEADDYSGKDQIQRRKTGTSRGGNDALFLRVPWGNTARFGTAPTAAGDPVQFRFGGSIDKLEFKRVRDLPLSTKNFDASSLSISNPVNNQLTIKGLNSDITKLSVYNLLGSKVLTQNVSGTSSLNINVSNLVSGMYIVKLEGANGAFSKKIIKQ